MNFSVILMDIYAELLSSTRISFYLIRKKDFDLAFILMFISVFHFCFQLISTYVACQTIDLHAVA